MGGRLTAWLGVAWDVDAKGTDVKERVGVGASVGVEAWNKPSEEDGRDKKRWPRDMSLQGGIWRLGMVLWATE